MAGNLVFLQRNISKAKFVKNGLNIGYSSKNYYCLPEAIWGGGDKPKSTIMDTKNNDLTSIYNKTKKL